MTKPVFRSGPLITAAVTAIVILSSGIWASVAAAPRVQGTNSPSAKNEVLDLVKTLNVWITLNSDYPITQRALQRIVFVDAGFEVEHDGRATALGNSVRGVYVDDDASIYLVEPWLGTEFDQSVLLHELVHHRQVDAKHWYCEQAMEWDAYKLQEAFLSELGIDPQFHWVSILLESSCANRNHHPD